MGFSASKTLAVLFICAVLYESYALSAEDEELQGVLFRRLLGHERTRRKVAYPRTLGGYMMSRSFGSYGGGFGGYGQSSGYPYGQQWGPYGAYSGGYSPYNRG